MIEFIVFIGATCLILKWIDNIGGQKIWPFTILFLAWNYIWSEFHHGEILFEWYIVVGPIMFDIVVWGLCALYGIVKTLTGKEK